MINWSLSLLLAHLFIQTLVSCAPIHSKQEHVGVKHENSAQKKDKDLITKAKHLKKSLNKAYDDLNLKAFSAQALPNLEEKFQTIKELGGIINCKLHSKDFIVDGNRVICEGREYYLSPEAEVDAVDLGQRRQGIYTPNDGKPESLPGMFSKGIYGRPLVSFLGDPYNSPATKDLAPHRRFPNMGLYDNGLRELDRIITGGEENKALPLPKGMDGQLPETPQEAVVPHGIGDQFPTIGPGLGGEAVRGNDLEAIPESTSPLGIESKFDGGYISRSQHLHSPKALGLESNFDGGYIVRSQHSHSGSPAPDLPNLWTRLENGFYGSTSSQLGIRDPTLNSDLQSPGQEKSGLHVRSKTAEPTKRSDVAKKPLSKKKHVRAAKRHKKHKPTVAPDSTEDGGKRYFILGSNYPSMSEAGTPSANDNPNPSVAGFTRYGPFFMNFGRTIQPVMFPFGGQKNDQSRPFARQLPSLSLSQLGFSRLIPQFTGAKAALPTLESLREAFPRGPSIPSIQYVLPGRAQMMLKNLARPSGMFSGNDAQEQAQFAGQENQEQSVSHSDDENARAGVQYGLKIGSSPPSLFKPDDADTRAGVQYGVQPGGPPPYVGNGHHPYHQFSGRRLEGYMSVPIVEPVPFGFPVPGHYKDNIGTSHVGAVGNEFSYGHPNQKEEDASAEFESMSASQPSLPAQMYREPDYDPHESEDFFPNGVPGREQKDKSVARELMTYHNKVDDGDDEDNQGRAGPIGKADNDNDSDNSDSPFPRPDSEARMLMNNGPLDSESARFESDSRRFDSDSNSAAESEGDENGSKRDKQERDKPDTLVGAKIEKKPDGRVVFTKDHVGFGPITVEAKTAKSAMKDPGDDDDDK